MAVRQLKKKDKRVKDPGARAIMTMHVSGAQNFLLI